MTETARRAQRSPLTRGRLYRTLVPLALAVLAVITVVILILAGGVLLGIVPYPGK